MGIKLLMVSPTLQSSFLEPPASTCLCGHVHPCAEAIAADGSGIRYERARYERALQGRPPSQALPKTAAWLRKTLAQAS